MYNQMQHQVDGIYALLQQLPRFDYLSPKDQFPDDGIYLFFEEGETVSWRNQQVPRLVRVGTHNKDGRFPSRIRQHYGHVNSLRGNKNGSVFRKHVGSALLRKSDLQDPRLEQWLGQRGGSFPEVEEEVSQTLRENFTFSCVCVDEAADRLALERGLIALLAQYSPWKPSENWLGLHAANKKIRECGLWNVQRTTSQPISSNELRQLRQMIEVTLNR